MRALDRPSTGSLPKASVREAFSWGDTHLARHPALKGISVGLLSCGWCWGGWGLMGFCFVARECSGYVDVSSGGGEGGLFVVLFLAVCPGVVGAGFGVVTGGRFGRGVAGAQQSVVVALGAVRVPADASGVFGDGCDACDV